MGVEYNDLIGIGDIKACPLMPIKHISFYGTFIVCIREKCQWWELCKSLASKGKQVEGK